MDKLFPEINLEPYNKIVKILGNFFVSLFHTTYQSLKTIANLKH